MPKVFTAAEKEAFEEKGGFAHGGRTGIEESLGFSFESLCTGDLIGIEQSEWWNGEGKEVTADTFLGSFTRYANKRNLRVSKEVAADGKSVIIQTSVMPPRKPKEAKQENAKEGAAKKPPKVAA